MSRVLIVNMPFANLRWPNLGPSLLKAALAQRGIGCDVAYLSFDFAERIGLDDYQWIADSFAFVLGGERLFAKEYFAGRLPDDDSYFRDVLLATDPGLSGKDRADYERAGEHVVPLLDHAIESIDWSRYAVVGFSASFQQTMASICLARRAKRVRPDVPVVFGGAACEGEMGIELLRQFSEIDYVFLGEADLTFPPVVEQILAGGPVRLPPGVISRVGATGSSPARAFRALADKPPVAPGVAGRDHDPAASRPTCSEILSADPALSAAGDAAAPMVRRMDELPYPDFDDYFARLRASPLAERIEPLVFFETSRGCWWGQKHHCAFCGLNGSTLAYRSKSPERAVDELRWLARRYGVRRASASDNVLDHRYFHTLLPMLKEAGLDLKIVYEMKTNLSRRQVEVLRDAGLGAAQLGIESFITPVLRAIDKGANALQNLQALKWFSEAGIDVQWNVLYGFPGESPADYAAFADLVPSLVHLAPPLAVGRVRLDRFSPYFRDPEAHGMLRVRPNRALAHVYPFPAGSLARIAYHFEFDYADGREPLDYTAPLLAALDSWQQIAGSVTLRYYDRPDGVLILHDTRPCAGEFQRRLTRPARRIYLYCDAGRSLEKIVRLAASGSVDPPLGESAVRGLLEEWIAARIMAHLDGRYVSLALRAPEPPPQ